MKSHNVPDCLARVETAGTNCALLPIVLASDAAYAMPLATTLRSIAESNRDTWPLEIHVIHDGINEATKRRVLESLPAGAASVDWHPVDLSSFASGCTALPYISKMTFARLLLPQLLPQISGKLLYLDSDILVTRGLARLCNADLGDAVIGAVLDPLDGCIKSNKRGLKKSPRVGRYFNAGVLLIDLDKWRSEQIPQRALEYLDRFPKSPFSDQDALNVACDGKWRELGGEWNFQCAPLQSIASIPAEQRPAIIHFVTGLKPWKPGSLSPNASYYDAVRARTCFARTRWMSVGESMQRFAHQLLKQSSFLRAVWSRAKPSLRTRTNSLLQRRSEDP